MYGHDDMLRFLFALQNQLAWQGEMLMRLERTLEQMRQDMASMAQRNTTHIERIDYKFDQLKVEKLEGTLNIGLTPDGSGWIEELSTEGNVQEDVVSGKGVGLDTGAATGTSAGEAASDAGGGAGPIGGAGPALQADDTSTEGGVQRGVRSGGGKHTLGDTNASVAGEEAGGESGIRATVPVDYINNNTIGNMEGIYSIIHQQIYQLLRHDILPQIVQLEEKYDHPLDDGYRRIIVDDVRKQLDERILLIVRNLPGRGGTGNKQSARQKADQIVARLKNDVRAGLETYFKQFKEDNK